jgi:hypothetical protein
MPKTVSYNVNINQIDIKQIFQILTNYWDIRTHCYAMLPCPGLDSGRYQIFWAEVRLERSLFRLLRITEELLEWKISGSSL